MITVKVREGGSIIYRMGGYVLPGFCFTVTTS